MPTYEYICKSCRVLYEVQKPMSEGHIAEPCPECMEQGERYWPGMTHSVTGSNKKRGDGVNWSKDDQQTAFKKQLREYANAGRFEKMKQEKKLTTKQMQGYYRVLEKRLKVTPNTMV